MIKRILSALAVLCLCASVAGSQVVPFPQSLPASTVIGRLGISAGPAQAIPFANLSAALSSSISQAANCKSPTYGAKGDGTTDDTGALQTCINSTNAVYIPSGTYLVSQCLTVPSTRLIYGDGWSTVLKASASLPACPSFTALGGGFGTAFFILTNSDYTNGNTDIIVRDLATDMTNKDVGNGHNIHLRNVTRARVNRVYTNRGGDGVAFTKSADFAVTDSQANNHSNAGLDTYDGSRDGLFMGNIVEGGNASGSYGILATGLTGDNLAATTSRIRVIGNTVRNVNQLGVWIQGGVAGAQVGSVTDAEVIGNNIDTVTAFHGIRCSESTRVVIANNTLSTLQKVGISNVGEGASGACTDLAIIGNTINNASQAAAGDSPAIELGSGAQRNTVSGNITRGSNHTFGVVADSGATFNVISWDNILNGLTNTISNAGGTTNSFAEVLSGTPNLYSPLSFQGSSSGRITLQTQAASGTYNWNWPTTAGASGTILQSGGGGATAMSFSTATYPATTTANQLLYSSAANTVSGLATANNSILVTDGSGVPSLQNTAWSAFTPSVACGTATFTTNSARRLTIGKTTNVELDFTITAIGTCTQALSFTIPNTANSAAALAGQEIAINNNLGACVVASASATANCRKQIGGNFLVNERFVFSGVYENQ